jgi:coenzyme Q-binding protein COQ10
MPKMNSESHSSYTPKQLMSLILDIESYPQFIPWCQAARVISCDEGFVVADMVIAFQSFTESYRSQVEVIHNLDDAISINVHAISGPFTYLLNQWQLIPRSQGAMVHFMVDFSFKSVILNKLIGVFFSKAAGEIVEAFEQRANHLFGQYPL